MQKKGAGLEPVPPKKQITITELSYRYGYIDFINMDVSDVENFINNY